MLLLPEYSSLTTARDVVHHVDLLTLCNALAPQSVDMILADLPYGTTACSWDEVIPFEPMWTAFKRVIKPRGAIVLTASQPFTTKLIASNIKMFKYCWYWYKNIVSGFQLASIQPTRAMEEICIFYQGQPTYNPQPTKSRISDRQVTIGAPNGAKAPRKKDDHKFGTHAQQYHFPEFVAPRNVLEIPCVPHASGNLHPTQKPEDLFIYLIRTYTRVGELVLDPTCGSGTTAIAARHTGRHFICGDTSAEYVRVARERLAMPYTIPMLLEAV